MQTNNSIVEQIKTNKDILPTVLYVASQLEQKQITEAITDYAVNTMNHPKDLVDKTIAGLEDKALHNYLFKMLIVIDLKNNIRADYLTNLLETKRFINTIAFVANYIFTDVESLENIPLFSRFSRICRAFSIFNTINKEEFFSFTKDLEDSENPLNCLEVIAKRFDFWLNENKLVSSM